MKCKSASAAKTRTIAMAVLLLIAGASSRQEIAAQLKPEKARDGKLERSQTPKAQQVPKVRPLPDLVITNITYSRNLATIDVHNRGAETSKPCKLRFTLPGIEEFIYHVPRLFPKGFVHTVTISRNQPFSGKGVAKVDFDNQNVESNESNNEMSINQPAATPDLAAVQLYFKKEGGESKVIGVIQNVGEVGLIGKDSSLGFKGKVRLIRVAKYGAHQKITTIKEETLPSIGPGIRYEVKATTPPPFAGADSYLWMLVVDADDANPANDKIEKKSVKFDNNN